MEAQGTAATEGPGGGAPVPRLRPLSFGEILDVAIKLCVANAATLLKAVVFVVLPVVVVSTIIIVATGGAEFDAFSGNTEGKSDREVNTYLAGQLAAALLQTVAVWLATAACFRAIARAYLDEKPEWRESLKFASKRMPPMLWVGMLYLAAIIAIVVVLVIPMALAGTVAAVVVGAVIMVGLFVWLYIAWSFAIPALLVEDVRGVKALKRSQQLVKGRWWQTFAIVALGFILAAVTAGVVQFFFSAIVLVGIDSSSLLALLIISVAGLMSLLVTTPFQAALLLVIYFDLRVRKEGFDLELLAERFGDGEASAAPAAVQQPAGIAAPEPPAEDGATPYWPAPTGPWSAEREERPQPLRDPGPPPPGWAPPR